VVLTTFSLPQLEHAEAAGPRRDGVASQERAG